MHDFFQDARKVGCRSRIHFYIVFQFRLFGGSNLQEFGHVIVVIGINNQLIGGFADGLHALLQGFDFHVYLGGEVVVAAEVGNNGAMGENGNSRFFLAAGNEKED